MFWCQQDIILKMSLFDELKKYSFHLLEFDVLPDIWRLQRGQSLKVCVLKVLMSKHRDMRETQKVSCFV